MAFLTIFVRLLGFDFFKVFQEHLFPEGSSQLYFSSYAQMVQYFPSWDVTGSCVDICEFLSVPSLKFLFSMSCGDLLPSSYACFCQPSFLTLTVLPLLRADACLTSKLCDSFPLVSFLHAFSVEQFFLTSVAQMISVIGHIFYPFFHKELKSLNV